MNRQSDFTQGDLLSYRTKQKVGVKARFDGPAYSPADDDVRLSDQLARIKNLMLDGQWRSLKEISEQAAAPQASVSAQLRHLRKPRFGSYTVERRNRGGGLHEYRVLPPLEGIASPKKRKSALRDMAQRVAHLEQLVRELGGKP